MTKITDLTMKFLDALDHRTGWVPDRLATDLYTFSVTVGARFEWGKDEGEHWMHVDDGNGRLLALVWSVAPLAILKPPALPLIGALLQRYGVALEVVDNWRVPKFALDPQAVEAVSATRFWQTDPRAVSISHFSILDLLAATE